MIGDGERITVALVAEFELALIISTPQGVRAGARTERCAFGACARSGGASHLSMPIQDGVDGAASWDFDFARQSSKEALPDLAGAPLRFLAFGSYDGGFDLRGQLVGIAVGAPGPIREPLQSTFLIALEDLIWMQGGLTSLRPTRTYRRRKKATPPALRLLPCPVAWPSCAPRGVWRDRRRA